VLFNRANPYNGIDENFPPLAYLTRHVRGGRSRDGANAMGRLAMLIVAVVVLLPLALLLVFVRPAYAVPNYWLQNSWWYALVVMGLSIVTFPLVDFFTVFFAVNSIRSDIKDTVKFDLLRASLVDPAAYIDTRIALARLRTWRVFVFFWVARWAAVVFVGLLGLTTLFVQFIEDGFPFDLLTDARFAFALTMVSMGVLIFLVQLLAEPLWRLEMLTVFSVSVAARLRSNTAAWLVVGLGVLGIALAQGAFAAAVIWLAVGFFEVVEELLRFLDVGTYDMRENLTWAVGMFPYAVMPLAVWALQRWFRLWRYRVAVRYIFKAQGGDA